MRFGKHSIPDSERLRKTFVFVGCGRFRVTLKIQGALNQRQRRAIAICLVRALQPKFNLMSCWISHYDDHSMYAVQEMYRGTHLHFGQDLDDPKGRIGFQVRMRRLELKLTQRELAARVEMSREHLGKLERGLYTAQRATLRRLSETLGVSLKSERIV